MFFVNKALVSPNKKFTKKEEINQKEDKKEEKYNLRLIFINDIMFFSYKTIQFTFYYDIINPAR